MLCITFSGVFLYSSEVFPTAVRTQGMGLSSLAARFGAGLAPLVVVVLGEALASRCSRLMRCQAARAYVALATDTRAGVRAGADGGDAPMFVFGFVSFIAGVLSLRLPETLNQTLADTL